MGGNLFTTERPMDQAHVCFCCVTQLTDVNFQRGGKTVDWMYVPCIFEAGIQGSHINPGDVSV